MQKKQWIIFLNLFQTQGEKHVEKLNEAIVLGECIQTTLFPSAKFT